MGNSENNLAQTNLQSLIIKLTGSRGFNEDLTLHDKVLINKILIGSAKMISTLYDEFLKKVSKSERLFSQYNIGYAYSLGFLLIALKYRVQQSDIQRELRLLKSVQPSDVSEYLSMMVKLGIKVKKKTQKPKSSRGRPIESWTTGTNKPGRPTEYYEDSPYIEHVGRLLSNRISGNLIYCYLVESMLLQKWVYSMVLLSLYRLNHVGPETLINSDRILFTPDIHT
jgi:hypothetical protein